MSIEQSTEAEEQVDANVTQEALDAANEEEVKEPEMMPVAAHVASKHKLQERTRSAELETAELRGRMSALEAKSAPVAVKSPLDVEMERQAADGIDEEDMTISPALLRREQKYQAQLTAEAAQIESQKNLGMVQTASVNTARLVHDDFDAVLAKGQKLMTNGEYLDVTEAGENFGQLAYDTAKAAIARSKPAPKAEPAPKKEPSEPETEAKKVPKAAPTQDEVLDKVRSERPDIDAKMRL